ncbi:MAG: filamentous hemagglutinin N-terminal domain-containing protein, partial [Leptolyngbyaceae cyanobacterium bins.59]|nr:filamentous hemagglutinin N-terminal domain-containing protein [Leptolyngbyaceae cyanobacterium bins.59]
MHRRDRTPFLLWLCFLVATVLTSGTPKVAAQITPDTTLGPGNNSVVSPNPDVLNRSDITGGLRLNSALFHSFQQFNVGNGLQVYFANPSGIQNIFSRITGGDLSRIDGVLGVAGAANLFLMNPNGIVFGPNARLDVSGSFLATTAKAVEFSNGQIFAAGGDRAVPLVEVNIPIGLQFGAAPPAVLSSQANLATGRDLTLAAGNLDLQGQVQAGGNLTLQATDTVRIRDTVATPFLARSGGEMLIQGNQGIDILALNHLETPFISGRDLSLISNGMISGDAHFTSGGNLSIQTLTGELGTFVSLYDPIIRSVGNVTFGTYSGASLKVEAAGSIRATGSINIVRPDLGIAVGSDPDAAILRGGNALI